MYPKWGKYFAVLMIGTILLSLVFTYSLSATTTETSDEEIRNLSEGPWPSFGRDSSNTRLSPHSTIHVDGTVDWSYGTDLSLWSSPAIGSEGLIYFGSPDNDLYALDVDSGTDQWTFSSGGDILSSPAVSSEEVIYFGSGDHNIYALNQDGSLKWSYPTDGPVYSSPTVDEAGNVYVGSYDGNLYSIDEQGVLNWKFSSDSWLWSSPSIGENDVVYVGSGDMNLYAIDIDDGTELWRYSTDGQIYSSPAVDEEGNIYFGSNDGHIYSLDPDGSLNWSYNLGSRIHPSPAIGQDGVIYIGSYSGEFFALKEGEIIWSFSTGDRISSSAAVCADGMIYFGSYDGNFYALDPQGNQRWYHEVGSTIYSSPAIGDDGNVFVNGWNGNMYAFTGKQEEDPGINIDIWRELEISVRIAGRINNGITAEIEENGSYVDSLELTRRPGEPQSGSMYVDFREGSEFNLTLIYKGDHQGSNPIWVSFRSGDRYYTIFNNFNTKDGEEQSIVYNLSEEIGELISKVREIHFSAYGDYNENNVTSYVWHFGDGETAEGRRVTHTYDSSGEYHVTLTITFKNGDVFVVERTLTIIDVQSIETSPIVYSHVTNTNRVNGVDTVLYPK